MMPGRDGPRFAPRDPDFAARIETSFKRQKAMETLGIRLETVAPGTVTLGFDMAPGLSQQQGFVHGGVLTAALDSACGYAGLSLSPAGWDVLTIEFKVNFLSPARADRFSAQGRVIKVGRTITVCDGQAMAVIGQEQTLIATMSATLYMLAPDGKGPARSGAGPRP